MYADYGGTVHAIHSLSERAKRLVGHKNAPGLTCGSFD